MNRNNRKRPRIVFIVLIVICVALIAASASGNNFSCGGRAVSLILRPMQSGINAIGGLASSASEKRKDKAMLESENDSLRSKVDDLQSQITSMQQNLADYDDLLKLTGLSEKYPGYKMTGARIIGKDPGNWYSRFTINKGSSDGIKVNMNVVADDGLVGIVTKVGPASSVVRSIIDDTSSVSAMISKNYDNCIVEGDLKLINKGLLNVEMISDDTSVVEGDEVVTSYISDKYLPGILIGYISEITTDEKDLSFHAKLTPVVDFEHLSTVMVIEDLRSDLNRSGEKQQSSGGSSSSGEEKQTEK